MSEKPRARFDFGNGLILKKFLPRPLISPLYFAFKRNEAFIYSSDPDKYFKFNLKIGEFFGFRIHPISRSGGSCDTSAFLFDFKVRENWYYTSITWRLDVTWREWNKDTYFAHKRKQYEKKYGKLENKANI